MNNEQEKLSGLAISKENKFLGYGTFPYVIIRIQGGVYMQFPIEFYEGSSSEKPGIRIKVDDISNLQENYSDLLIAIKSFKANIEEQSGNQYRLCLILNERLVYFFEENKVQLSASIPDGGTLLNVHYDVIAMNRPHYIS